MSAWRTLMARFTISWGSLSRSKSYSRFFPQLFAGGCERVEGWRALVLAASAAQRIGGQLVRKKQQNVGCHLMSPLPCCSCWLAASLPGPIVCRGVQIRLARLCGFLR